MVVQWLTSALAGSWIVSVAYMLSSFLLVTAGHCQSGFCLLLAAFTRAAPTSNVFLARHDTGGMM